MPPMVQQKEEKVKKSFGHKKFGRFLGLLGHVVVIVKHVANAIVLSVHCTM